MSKVIVRLLETAPWYNGQEKSPVWKAAAHGRPCEECMAEQMPTVYLGSRDGALEALAVECELIADAYKAMAVEARAMKDYP